MKEQNGRNWSQKIKDLIGKRKKTAFLVVVLVIVALFWRYYTNRNGDGLEKVEVKRGVVEEEMIISGTIRADEHANLTFQTSGEVDWIGVKEGDEVKKGQSLAKLDTDILNFTLQSAEADLRRYQSSLDKTYDDVQGHDTDESFSQIEARTISETAKDKAYWNLRTAQKNISSSQITAPFDGVITGVVNPFTGVNAVYTQSQIEIVNPRTIYFFVTADQSEVTELSLNQNVKIVLDSYPDEEMSGKIEFISYTPISSEAGATYRVKVVFDTIEKLRKDFRVGMTGDAKFILNQKENVLYAPSDFVNADSDGRYVRKSAKNNKVYVEVGLEGEDRIEIISDQIREGDILYD